MQPSHYYPSTDSESNQQHFQQKYVHHFIPLPPPLLLPPPVLKCNPNLKQLIQKNQITYRSKQDQMLIKHPPIENNNPTLAINRSYTQQQLKQQDKHLFKMCDVCLNWLKQSDLQFHKKCHATLIDTGLYLGSSTNSSNIKQLKRLNIKCILNCSTQIPNTFNQSHQFIYKKLTLTDTVGQSIKSFFSECTLFIHQSLAKNENILVHCAMGKSRSATLVIAYLMFYKNINLRQAYFHVKSKRDIITLNLTYAQQLIDLDRQLFGNSSIKITQIKTATKSI